MLGIENAVLADNQPIGGGTGATLFGETKLLTHWITPDSIDVKTVYDRITEGINNEQDRIIACAKYVASIPYRRFVKTQLTINGKTIVQDDAWLTPAQALHAPSLNCANKSYLLTAMLRQELSPNEAYSVIGNLNKERQDGHAWNMVRLPGGDYLLEPTNLPQKITLVPVSETPEYEDVMYLSDNGVWEIPQRKVREPLTDCYHCLNFLEDYLDPKHCY